MIFRLDRFFFDEKDIATWLFGLFLLVSTYFGIPVAPFRFASLVVLFVFLLVTRSLKNSVSYNGYFILTLSGILFSLALSPYGLAIYLFIGSVIYLKWGRG